MVLFRGSDIDACPTSCFFVCVFYVAQVGIDIGFHVQTFLSEADMGVRMTGGNVAVMGDMVRRTTYNLPKGSHCSGIAKLSHVGQGLSLPPTNHTNRLH